MSGKGGSGSSSGQDDDGHGKGTANSMLRDDDRAANSDRGQQRAATLNTKGNKTGGGSPVHNSRTRKKRAR